MSESLLLNENEHTIWQTLLADGPSEIGALAEKTGIDQSQVAAAAAEGARSGHIEIQEFPREELTAAEDASETLKAGVPERRAASRIADAGGRMPVAELVAWCRAEGLPANEIFRWGPTRGWLGKLTDGDEPCWVLTESGHEALGGSDDDERALQFAVDAGPVYLDTLASRGIDPDRVRRLLAKRPALARIRKRTERILSLTESGRQALTRGVRVVRERNVLTPEDLASGDWREITLRPYDVSLPAKEIFPAKSHPLRKVMEETRRAFLEMGFSEVASPMVESAFWNFDALFQPQDHPARDMQDTFYMKHPERLTLPDDAIVDPIRRTHEDGWETGSEGWGYRWSEERARQAVLRTHTTAATIRALARHPDPPAKFFCVGWTYRNETISFKHLPVFHQVDGIVIDEEASLATLLGTLREFYRKMGFDKVKFKPAFYPYTEPSVDVVVYMESRGTWLEMGGSGIFRPEVTLPLGCRHPVLAWGLGIERLAMLRCGFTDIRELYRSRLDALEKVALCR